ncbi:MAG: STAS domain-containing protein [Gammaproteobacteria bacterium]|nr:STAS domain-containing protein [Gammaproteobacteria bacterium]
MSSVNFADGLIRVSGPLTLETVSRVLGESRQFFSRELRGVDLGSVTEVDSSALALIVEWLQLARAVGAQLGFEQIPPVLLDLAQSSGFGEIEPSFRS